MIAPAMAVATASWMEVTKESTKASLVKILSMLSRVKPPPDVVNAPTVTMSVGTTRNTRT